MAEEDPATAAAIVAQLTEQGEAAAVEPWLQWAWRAWFALTDERSWRGGGMGPALPSNIPWTAVRLYAVEHGHPLAVLFRLLRAMDDVYAAWWAERAAEAQQKQEAG